MRATLYLAVAGLALVAQPAAAQGSCEDIGKLFQKPPKLGEWAELRMDRAKDQGKKPTMMRVAIVEKEEGQGRPMYRMQMIMTPPEGQRNVMQVLTPWGLDALSGDYDTEIVMKMGDQQAVVMPVKAGQGPPGMSDLRKECAKVTFVGEEQITVPAGSFETRHYTGPDGDSWVSPEVPGWRMVRMATTKGDTMVLTGTGTGEQNAITEEPVDVKKAMLNPRKFPKPDKEDKDK